MICDYLYFWPYLAGARPVLKRIATREKPALPSCETKNPAPAVPARDPKIQTLRETLA